MVFIDSLCLLLQKSAESLSHVCLTSNTFLFESFFSKKGCKYHLLFTVKQIHYKHDYNNEIFVAAVEEVGS